MRMPKFEKLVSKPEWVAKAAAIKGRADEFARLFRANDYEKPDDFFFSFEDLPSLGKEYWFMHFCAPGKDEQAVLTLGRSVEDVVVNRSSLKTDKDAAGRTCAAVCWLYSGRKKVIFDSLARVETGRKNGKNSLVASDKEGTVSITGRYPSFDIELKKSGKTLFSATAHKPKKGKPYELVYLLQNPIARGFGAVMVNYYFDFEGSMEGKKISGRAYLQKVVAAMPFAPWNWVRLQFSKDVSLDYFVARPLLQMPPIHFACNDFIEIKGRRIPLSNLKLESFSDGESKRWVLSNKEIFVSMETYALQPFFMRHKTTFEYDEYLVRVKDLAFRHKGRTYTLSELGQGSGLVEDAIGYLI